MRIAFVSEHYPSQDQTQYCVYLQQQALALKHLGDDVEVIRLLKGKEYVTEDCLEGILIRNVSILSKRSDRIFADYTHRLSDKINWSTYDVVSIHIVSTAFASAVVAECNKAKVPVVYHFHGLNVWNNYNEKKNIVHKLLHQVDLHRKISLLKRCQAIVGVSKGVCAVVQERLLTPKSYLVYNGVDIDKFPRTVKQVSNNGEFRILCVANYIPIKGQSYLIKAVHVLLTRGYNIMLHLIGQGPDEGLLKSLVKELGIEDRVRFLGLQPYDEVYRYMTQSDMFIMPSYYDSFGCVYVEAMSTGTVTCGCNVFGPSEIIHDGIDGLLVEPQNVDSIVNAVRRIVENPELRTTLETNAVKRAAEFSWIASAVELEKVYESLD